MNEWMNCMNVWINKLRGKIKRKRYNQCWFGGTAWDLQKKKNKKTTKQQKKKKTQ